MHDGKKQRGLPYILLMTAAAALDLAIILFIIRVLVHSAHTNLNLNSIYGSGSKIPGIGYYDLYKGSEYHNSMIPGHVGFDSTSNKVVIQYMAKDNIHNGWFEVDKNLVAIKEGGDGYPHMVITVNNSVDLYLPSDTPIIMCGQQFAGRYSTVSCGLQQFTSVTAADRSSYNSFIHSLIHK